MLEQIYFNVLKDISPEKLIADFLKKHGKDFSNCNVVSLGKAAIPMLKGFTRVFNFNSAFVVAPEGTDISPFEKEKNVQLILSTHPDITKKSLFAAKSLIDFLNNSTVFTVFLISGGASALMELPLDFLSLEEVSQASNYLVKSGIPIEDINFARIHLSKIKGGGLLNYLAGEGEAFVLCDVLGDRIDRVSSAPLYRVERNFKAFVDFADKIDLWQIIAPYKREEFLNNDFKITDKSVPHFIAASNSLVVEKFADYLLEKGKNPLIFKNFIKFDVEKQADEIFEAFVKEIVENGKDTLVFGGEATVRVKGKGKGGRTLELALRFLKRLLGLENLPEIEIISATTDGMDGNSGCAGIFVPYERLREILQRETPQSMDYYLENSDTFSFFDKYGCLIKTGYTGNNLLDVFAILRV